MIGILSITGPRSRGYGGLDIESFATFRHPLYAFVCLFGNVGQRLERGYVRSVRHDICIEFILYKEA